jgi:hypothetical protein
MMYIEKAHHLYLAALFILITLVSYGQDTTFYENGVEITMDKKIYSLIQAKCNKKYHTMVPGWRIQLDFSTNKENLEDARMRFIKYHPEIETYITFDAPNWYLRVGNFEDRGDAELFTEEIRVHYRGVFTLPSKVFQKKEEE